MEVTSDDIKHQYQLLSNNELLEIYLNKSQYSDLAIQILNEEIIERGLTEQDFDNFYAFKIIKEDERFKRNYFDELSIWGKLACYYFVIVIFWGFIFVNLIVDAAKKEGYQLQIRQGVLFSFSSILFGAVALIINKSWGTYVWFCGFWVPLFFDYVASKKRKINYNNVYSKVSDND